MISPAELKALEEMDFSEETLTPPDSITPAICRYCYRLISDRPDERTPSICSDCSSKLTLGTPSVFDGPRHRAFSPDRQTSLFREFNTAIEGILTNLHDMLTIDDNDAEFELRATSLWKQIGDLARYTGCSEQHNELISTLVQVAYSELKDAFSSEKAQALEGAFEILKGQYILPDVLLDRVYNALRGGRFDINYSMSFQ